jgi:tRNA(Ile)-lysidine synthase
LHFNHRLRGAAADQDAQFCRDLAQGLGMAYASATWKKATKEGGEAAARAARFAFFDSACQTRRIDTLIFGHQQDDIAESILMRLARGSSVGGLAAPRPVHRQETGRVHVRPLLTLRKAAIEEWLEAGFIPWRKDATNAAPTFFRNRIRAEVIPAWREAAGRDAVAGAALSRERLEEDDDALEAWVDRLDLFTARGALRLTVLAGVPRAVARRALHRWLLRQVPAADISRQAFEILLASVVAAKPTRHSLGPQGFAVLAKGRLNYVLGPI